MPSKPKKIFFAPEGLQPNVWYKIGRGQLPPEGALIAYHSRVIGWCYKGMVTASNVKYLTRVSDWRPYTHFILLHAPDDRQQPWENREGTLGD